ncbi:MAG: histidine--tRNA ligase [Chloroflexi bacterium]|nr:histidine--tRNA ligase [Chloroflexota bacterium]
MRYQAPRGTADILPQDQPYWDLVRDAARDLARRYGYRRIDTPVFEDASLFVRTVGEGTDIVEKETYTFEDRGGDLMTLRPEGTAPVCRAYLQHGMRSLPQPVRLYYLAPIFRYERPQAGRYRQHWQVGAEAIGDSSPDLDAEVIDLLWRLLTGLGLPDLVLHLNTIGDATCRPAYLEALRAHYAPHLDRVCDDCRVRYEKNPLRLLDCKQGRCQPVIASAPQLLDRLCDACADHFADLRRILDLVEIPYVLAPRLVRGLDYYTRTVFEVQPSQAGSQTALGGGGRYDGLIEALGGPPTPGVGFGSGIERIILNLQAAGLSPQDHARPDLFLCYLGQAARDRALLLAADLRARGLAVQMATGRRSLRAQLRQADQARAPRTLLLGDDELAANQVILRDMTSGQQESLSLDSVVEDLAKGC